MRGSSRRGTLRTVYTCMAVVLSVVAQGCHYGSMIGAANLGESGMTLTGSVGLPAYLSSNDRRQAGETDTDDVPVSPGLTFLAGATDRIDVGVYARGYGIGPIARVGLLEPGGTAAVSVSAGAGYVIPAKLLSTRFGIAAGYGYGRSLEVYAGWDGGYGPDVVNIPKDTDGDSDWSSIANRFHHFVSAGIIYLLPRSGGDWVPESVGFEFAVPLDLSRNLVMFGMAVTY